MKTSQLVVLAALGVLALCVAMFVGMAIFAASRSEGNTAVTPVGTVGSTTSNYG